MPTAAGWPTEAECVRKLDSLPIDSPDASLLIEVAPILAAVIAQIESPQGRDAKGGTGRSFTPLTETRVYDGTGFAYLEVDDIVPGTTVSVSVFGQSLPDVIVSNELHSQGHNTLIRPTYSQNAFPLAYMGWRRIFPRGRQNITVTATWGFAAQVPADLSEAARCEALRRLVTQGIVDLAGIGDTVQLSEFQANTAAGVSVWAQSSSIAIFKQLFDEAVARYRLEERTPAARMGRRMYG